MDESTRQELLKETLLSKKKNEDIVGTGLGLQLCKSMIKKNGGKFRIESELGKGKMIVSCLNPKMDNVTKTDYRGHPAERCLVKSAFSQ
jgi:K+-sensing histidine kinase KdpD